jgi:hypothetical protein
MPRSYRILRLCSGLAAVLVLSGCGGAGSIEKARDAAHEPRASLLPGLYKLSTTGSLFGLSARKTGIGREDQSMCVSSEMAGDWPSPFVRAHLFPDANCSFDEYNRKGNSLDGKISCSPPGREDGISGKVTIKYSGQMTADSTQLDTSFDVDLELSEEQKARDPETAAKLKQAMALMKHAGVKMEVTRAGDC